MTHCYTRPHFRFLIRPSQPAARCSLVEKRSDLSRYQVAKVSVQKTELGENQGIGRDQDPISGFMGPNGH
ncbi:hypothetical protein NXS19_005331 [Fusarium pseudograminearum]|nr:hypothetical protein NXS19_005331 [Fusarium pseudograminearum]